MIDKRKLFNSHFLDAHYFDENNLEGLPAYLLKKGLIDHDEKVISTEKPGEGNMNFVRRVTTDKRSFILKQGRPWVEKYPDIKAPVERLEVEAKYYKTIASDPFYSAYSPGLLDYDPENLILVFEDLGVGSDFTFLYNKSQIFHEELLTSLVAYISHLHNSDLRNYKSQFPSNQALKRLNHEHIFNYPYLVENGFDLNAIHPGLQDISMTVKMNDSLKGKILGLGQKYLSSGPVLIHGDYYPGSWLKVDHEVKVIDPEFAYFGYAEFDVAVMAAHLIMTWMELDKVENALNKYRKRSDFDYKLFSGFCGTEILRRIIGLAQLPLDLTLSEKSELIDLAIELINLPKSHKLL